MKKKKSLAVIICAVLLLMLFTGCKSDGEKAVVKVGGVDISHDMYYYFYMSTRSSMSGGDEDYWDDEENVEQLESTTMEYVKAYASMYLLAEKNDIALTKDDEKQVDADIDEMIESYGEEEYQDWLETSYMSSEVYRDLMLYNALAEKMEEELYADTGKYAITDEEFTEKLNTEYVRAVHILVTDEDTANQLLEQIQGGADFMTLAEEYNTDPGMSEDGYYFTHGMMVQPFEEAAFALQENQVSGVVPTDYGYHIIKRLPMEQDYITTNFSTLKADYYAIMLNDALSGVIEEAKVEELDGLKEFKA